ncbi:MAG TPA: hypothetical protein VNJ09_08020 [Chthonomonadales bacterium]|nr:hypothetical protein [Chthonomonadales bacterium]
MSGRTNRPPNRARKPTQTVIHQKEPEPFRVLLAIHRPRYRARAERAVAFEGWAVRSLLNREDPIGRMGQKRPDLFIVSVDLAKRQNIGYLRAAQRYRQEGMRIIALFENDEEARESADLCDVFLVSPWRTADLREVAASLHMTIRGAPPLQSITHDDAEDETAGR